MRWRTALGSLLLVAGLAAYAVAVVSLSDRLSKAHWAAQIVIFAIAGLLWVWPAARLIAWMKRDDS